MYSSDNLLDKSDIVAIQTDEKGFSNFQSLEALVFTDQSDKYSKWPIPNGSFRRGATSYNISTVQSNNVDGFPAVVNSKSNGKVQIELKNEISSSPKLNRNRNKVKRSLALARINQSLSSMEFKQEQSHADTANHLKQEFIKDNSKLDLSKIISTAEDLLLNIKISSNKKPLRSNQDCSENKPISFNNNAEAVNKFENHNSSIDWLLRGVPDIFEEDDPVITDEFVEKLLSEGGKPPSQLRYPTIYASSLRLMERLENTTKLSIDITHLAIYSSKFGVRKSCSYLVIKPPIACGTQYETVLLNCIEDTLSSMLNAENKDKRKGIPRKYSLRDYFVGAVDMANSLSFDIKMTNDVINDWFSCSSLSSCLRIELYSHLNEFTKLNSKTNQPLLYGYVDVPLAGLLGSEELDSVVTCQLNSHVHTHALVTQKINSLPNGPQILRSQPINNKLGSITLRLTLEQTDVKNTKTKELSNELEKILQIPSTETQTESELLVFDKKSKHSVNYLNIAPNNKVYDNTTNDIIEDAMNYVPIPPKIPKDVWSSNLRKSDMLDNYIAIAFYRINLHLLNFKSAITNVLTKYKLIKSNKFEFVFPLNNTIECVDIEIQSAQKHFNIHKLDDDKIFNLPIFELWVQSNSSNQLVGLAKVLDYNSNICYNEIIRIPVISINKGKELGYLDISCHFDHNYDEITKQVISKRVMYKYNLPSHEKYENRILDSQLLEVDLELKGTNVMKNDTTDVDIGSKIDDCINSLMEAELNNLFDFITFEKLLNTKAYACFDILIDNLMDFLIDEIITQIIISSFTSLNDDRNYKNKNLDHDSLLYSTFNSNLDETKEKIHNLSNEIINISSESELDFKIDNINYDNYLNTETHIIELSIDGTCSHNQFQYISLPNQINKDIDGYYLCYSLPFKSELKKYLLWWDSECVVLNSRNYHTINLTTNEINSFQDIKFDIKNEINNTTLGYAVLSKEILKEIFLIPGIYKVISLDIIPHKNIDFNLRHVIITISHRIEPTLMKHEMYNNTNNINENIMYDGEKVSNDKESDFYKNIEKINRVNLIEVDHKVDESIAVFLYDEINNLIDIVIDSFLNNRIKILTEIVNASHSTSNKLSDKLSDKIDEDIIGIDSSNIAYDTSINSFESFIAISLNGNDSYDDLTNLDLTVDNLQNDTTSTGSDLESEDIFNVGIDMIIVEGYVEKTVDFVLNHTLNDLIYKIAKSKCISSQKNYLSKDNANLPVKDITLKSYDNSNESNDILTNMLSDMSRNTRLDCTFDDTPVGSFVEINHQTISKYIPSDNLNELRNKINNVIIRTYLNSLLIDSLKDMLISTCIDAVIEIVINRSFNDIINVLESDLIDAVTHDLWNNMNHSSSTLPIDVISNTIIFSEAISLNNELMRIYEDNFGDVDFNDKGVDGFIDIGDDGFNDKGNDGFNDISDDGFNDKGDDGFNDKQIEEENTISTPIHRSNKSKIYDISDSLNDDITDKKINEKDSKKFVFGGNSEIVNRSNKDSPIFSLTSVYSSTCTSSVISELSFDNISIDKSSNNENVAVSKVDEAIQVNIVDIKMSNNSKENEEYSPKTTQILQLVDKKIEQQFEKLPINKINREDNVTSNVILQRSVEKLPFPFDSIESNLSQNNSVIPISNNYESDISHEVNLKLNVCNSQEASQKSYHISTLLSDKVQPHLLNLREQALNRNLLQYQSNINNNNSNFRITAISRKYLDDETIRVSKIMKEKIFKT